MASMGLPGPQSPRWVMGNVASALLKLCSFHKEVRTPLQRPHELGEDPGSLHGARGHKLCHPNDADNVITGSSL